MCTNVLDHAIKAETTGQTNAKTEAFIEKVVGMINGSALTLMTSIGHRTGLFDAMAKLPPATSSEIASKAGLSERYVREWLGAMVTGGIVEYDVAEGRYALPAEYAAVLTSGSKPNLAVSCQWAAVLGAVENEVVEAFRHGKGVPYSAYTDFHRVMADESAQTVVGGLFEHILPAVPGLTARLERGIDVLDVGCGAGRALIEMALAYPRSRFTGYDFSEEAVRLARSEAEKRGAGNVRFLVKDAAAVDDVHAFDLVTAFDAIHDQAKPAQVLRNIARALRPGSGVFLMQDILAETKVHENHANPMAPFIYTISTMHCMSVSLANDGAGLGAAWGKEKAMEMLAAAGFIDTRVETLAHDTMNYYYVSRVA